MKTVYLAGGAAEFAYRQEVKDIYGDAFNLIDPILSSNELFERIGYDMKIERIFDKTKEKIILPSWVKEAIIKNDKAMIMASDYIVAYIDYVSFGTTMEISFSYHNRIPVYTIVVNELMMNDVWLSVHSTKMFNSIESCFLDLIPFEGEDDD